MYQKSTRQHKENQCVDQFFHLLHEVQPIRKLTFLHIQLLDQAISKIPEQYRPH